MFERKAEYDEYLKTSKWEELKNARLLLDENECVLCGEEAQVVHHRRYPEIFGEETTKDLISLCNTCHHNFHYPPSIVSLKDQLRLKKLKGCRCPLCDRYVKTYRRKLNSGMARVLIAICKFWKHNPPQEGWLHIAKTVPLLGVNANAGEYSKLRYWNLLEVSEDIGYWRPTQLAFDFIEDKIKVPSYVVLDNNKLIEISKTNISIIEALGCHFNYKELMSGYVLPI